MVSLVFIFVLILAYSNGANDNFKGVATLFGIGTMDSKKAIIRSTFSTLLGSLASILFASTLIKNFSGKGIVPNSLIASPQFIGAIALSAACTVFLAVNIGMPVSTTHALVGALSGAGWLAALWEFNFGRLSGIFFIPLIPSPFIAAVGSLILYVIFTTARKKLGITKESCTCNVQESPIYPFTGTTAIAENAIKIKTGTVTHCIEHYNGSIVGVSAQRVLDIFLFIRAGVVSFARRLNDTPKMVGLLLLISAIDLHISAVSVTIAIAIGGLLNTKKVGETMSKKIIAMNHGQGFTANLVNAILVKTACFNGLPVFTTHVSVGSLFGIGTVTRKSNGKVISSILSSWVLTLTFAAIISAHVYLLLTKIIS